MEGGGLGVGGEEDGAGTDGPVGLGEGVVGRGGGGGEVEGDVAGGVGAMVLVLGAVRGQSLEGSAKL